MRAGWYGDDYLILFDESEIVEPFCAPTQGAALKSDPRFAGKINWCVQPVVFGGNPRLGENIIWVDHSRHSQLVLFWNRKYRELKGNNPNKTD